MITFRCDAIVVADLEYTFVSALEPDASGLEVGLEGNSPFSIDATTDGRITVTFADIENAI
ncbi:hypothetical protein FHT01_001486 [Sphingomonas japonica]|uniref:Uncharacterized protein n=1 Tax=Sphingomonas japonica TaxID=511662 RepID=A0ABX0U2K2_9SPHN|nr:hypothetical protein [Sphingomonas japonica]